jgi:putative transposase
VRRTVQFPFIDPSPTNALWWRVSAPFGPQLQLATTRKAEFVVCDQPIYYHFRKWRLDGRLRQAHNRLRTAVRETEGREREPSAAVIDSQAVKGTGVGGPERGYDGAKRLSGRKRHLLVDSGGLVLGARVHAANLHDRDGAQGLLSDELKKELPRLELLWADGAYTSGFCRWAEEELGWRVEVPYHQDRQLWRYGLEEKPGGFRVLPRRWVVERTFAWLGQARSP